MQKLDQCFDRIIHEAHIYQAWERFSCGKMRRPGVLDFSAHLAERLYNLRCDILNNAYVHGDYRQFTVMDPKRRTISVPTVRDQVIHQMLWDEIFPFFDHRLSSSVCSCRPGFGTTKARTMIARGIKTHAAFGKVWVAHIDISAFFSSINHDLLISSLKTWIACERTMKLLIQVIRSFTPGIPLGNLTSQLFANVILMPIDRCIADMQGVSYVRYADDFFLISHNRARLDECTKVLSQKLFELGFLCTYSLVRAEGFEALDARFFSWGQCVARGTARRGLARLAFQVKQYELGNISANCLRDSFASLQSLDQNNIWWNRSLRDLLIASYASEAIDSVL